MSYPDLWLKLRKLLFIFLFCSPYIVTFSVDRVWKYSQGRIFIYTHFFVNGRWWLVFAMSEQLSPLVLLVSPEPIELQSCGWSRFKADTIIFQMGPTAAL